MKDYISPYSDEEIAKAIVDCAFSIHNQYGPGLLEKPYQEILAYEIDKLGFLTEKEVLLPIVHDNIIIHHGYRMDIWIEKRIVIEVKAVEALTDVHLAQVLHYLKLTSNRIGLLINFNVTNIGKGIKRVVNGY
ncbi:MAG: GxxExxY protein [Flavobacteriales bacterium]